VTPTIDTLRAAVDRHKVGDRVRLGVLQGQRRSIVTVPLVRDPSRPNHRAIGIAGQVVWEVKLGTPIRISTGQLGGPSAGLAFTLEIYDALTGRKLADGRRIAVTGTISPDGSVGPIGGMKQKALGARATHANLLIVPAGNAAEARRWAGSLKVVPVTSFAQALHAIRTSS
jgi:PDZ domain-containing protein